MNKTLMVVMSIMVIIVFVGAKAIQSETKPQSATVGRFQLFQGTFIALDAKNNRADKEIAIFLLDTSTGEVKKFQTGIDKSGKFFEDWLPTQK